MICNSQLGVTRIITYDFLRNKRRYHTNTNIKRNNYAYRYEKIFIQVSQFLKKSLMATSKTLLTFELH
jgi:hypothetical protein